MSLEKLETNKVKLTIEVPAEEFDAALSEAYIKTGKNYSIQGFRPGKRAPRAMIEAHYGPGIFYNDAFEEIYAAKYAEELKANDLTPVADPEIDLVQIEKGKNLIFTAVVTTYPEVGLGEYKGIEVERVEYNVTDSEVEGMLNTERERVARFVDVERPAQNGDRVTIDYSGSVNGVKFDGGTAEKQNLVLGSNSFIPGFEEAIVGMNKGEEHDITVKFPDDYHAEELKGKDAVFHVVLHEVKLKELPELDDEFAKDVSDFDTLDEFKADIRKHLEEQAQQRTQTALEDAAIAKVAEAASIEIPDVMIENQLSNMIRDFEYRMSYQGIDFQQYLNMMGSTIEDFRAQQRGSAERAVRTQLVLEEIKKRENIDVTDEELDKELEKYIVNAPDTDLAKFKASLSASDLAYVKRTITTDKAIKAIMDTAVIAEPKAKAKAKSKAKKTDEKAETNAEAGE
jgi:trigger factor